MNTILIHANNTTLTKDLFYSNNVVFSPNHHDDIDIQLSVFVNKFLSPIEYNGIFIKANLSHNYLEYLGLRLALHIRFSTQHPQLSSLPLIIITEETFEELSKLFEYPEFLSTEGIYFTTESKSTINKYLQLIDNNFLRRCDGINALVERINIRPPANYQSHHSITNEWSILRWAKTIGLPTSSGSLQFLKNKIEGLLYFKFLQAKYPIQTETIFSISNVPGPGKILYIDDDWNKGWDIVLNHLFSQSPKVEFRTLHHNYSDNTQADVINVCLDEIRLTDPDVILLDMRLLDSDFNPIKTTELTGYKILSAIKNVNPGIQVVIFTASNKVWNFTELQKAGADDFVLKESPELSSDPDYSRNCIEKLSSTLLEGLKMSFLKKVHLTINAIKLLPTYGNSEEEHEFNKRIQNNLGIAFKLLIDTKYSCKYFNYAYLQLFQIIEDFCNLSCVFKEGNDCYVYVNDKEVCVNKTLSDTWESAINFTSKYTLKHKTLPLKDKKKRLDTNYLVSAILIFRLGYENSSALNWTEIYTIRNTKAAHFNIEYTLNQEHIYTILNFIKIFINPKSQKETNVTKGLKAKTLEESIELLNRHFQK